MEKRPRRKTFASILIMGMLLSSMLFAASINWSDNTVFHNDFLTLSVKESGMLGECLHFVVNAISYTL